MAQLGVLYVLHYDYKNVVGDSSIAPTKMNLKSPIYLGGLPSTVKTPNWIKQKGGFNGCVRFLSISSAKETHKVDLTQPEVRGSGMGAGSCYSTVQAGSGFNGSAWLRFSEYSQLRCLIKKQAILKPGAHERKRPSKKSREVVSSAVSSRVRANFGEIFASRGRETNI